VSVVSVCVCLCVCVCRSAKHHVGSRQYVDSPLKEISYQKAEDSDDSVVGEHSPFIKHSRQRCVVGVVLSMFLF